MKSKHHKAISQYIWNRKNKLFRFSDLKKKVFGYNEYGGKKFFVWLCNRYNLRSFKKDGRVFLQKIPKKQKVGVETNDDN